MPKPPDGQPRASNRDISELVEAVQALGERARFLAVNLAVVAARIKKQGASTTRLNEDILDLVARITRASQDIGDAVRAIEQGQTGADPSSPGLWVSWQHIGVPDERTLERLTSSLNETLELSRYVFRLIREHTGPDSANTRSAPDTELTWSDDLPEDSSNRRDP
jgi:hypothetical protein